MVFDVVSKTVIAISGRFQFIPRIPYFTELSCSNSEKITLYAYIRYSRSSKYKSILCWCCFLDLINNTIFLKVQNVIDREMRYINKETSPKTAIPIYHIIWYGFVCFMGNKCLDEKYCKYATPYVNLCSRHMDDAMLWHLI